MRFPPAGMDYEARAARGGLLLRRRSIVFATSLWAYVVMRFGIKVGNFVPKNYLQQVVENSDFRKYDDGLRMILDCTGRTRACADGASRGRRLKRHPALWPAPAGRGDDDLFHALGDAQRPHSFHRRRARRLCLGRHRHESDGRSRHLASRKLLRPSGPRG
jgi:hypothetical protein